MFRRLLFLLFYFASWVIFFEAARIFFLLYEWTFTSHLPARLVFLSLWHGLKMDMSVAAYFTLPVCLFVLLSNYSGFFRRPLIYYIYTGILLFIQVILTMADVEIYRAWGHRIDYTPLNYFSSPREMWASVSHLPIFWILIGLLIIFLLLFWLFRKQIRKKMSYLQNSTLRGLQVFAILVFVVLLIIPIRGGLQLSPLNHSTVFFTNNQFANNAALNATWNFMESLTQRDALLRNPYEDPGGNSNKLLASFFIDTGYDEQVIDREKQLPNIILILWESFTEKALHISIDGRPVLPYFNELKKDGIFFSNCYASGDRTNKGLSAAISGYPALPKGSIINYPAKLPELPGLGKTFAAQGYDSWFYYGGEPEFANMKSYIMDQQFHHQVYKEQFAKKDLNSKWGAHDDVVMNRILSDAASFRSPFFVTFLTLSSHEPFETPVPTVFHGSSFSTKLLNALHYTDSSLYSMIQEMKKSDWWSNTIVVIVGDHGHYEPATGKRADDYRTPMLWLGGALTKKDTVISRTVSQLDIAGSLCGQLGLNRSVYKYSRNLFGKDGKNWAFFTYNDGIGLITDSTRMMYDNAGKKLVFEEGKVGIEQVKVAKRLMYDVYRDFLLR